MRIFLLTWFCWLATFGLMTAQENSVITNPDHVNQLNVLRNKATTARVKNLNKFAIDPLKSYDIALDTFFKAQIVDTIQKAENKFSEDTKNISSKNDSLDATIKKLQETKSVLQHKSNGLTRKALFAIGGWLLLVGGIVFFRRKKTSQLNAMVEKSRKQVLHSQSLFQKGQNIISSQKNSSVKLSDEAAIEKQNALQSIAEQIGKNKTDEKEKADVNALIKQYAFMFNGVMSGNTELVPITFTTDLEKNLPAIAIQKNEIGKLLMHIISNAVDAVKTKQLTAPKGYKPTVSISTRILPRFLQIRVKDNGSGIPDVELENVLKEFYTVPEESVRSGLGLSEAKIIMSELHKGEIKIESDSSRGTDVYLKFFTN